MNDAIAATRTIVSEFRAAMDESIAYSETHQSEVKQTLAQDLSLTMAVAEKQILGTNCSTTLNTAPIAQIENDMKQFGMITSEPPASVADRAPRDRAARPRLRPWALRRAVLAAALGLWQALSAAGVIRADEFPSMTQTASALWDQAASATLWSASGQTLEGWAIGLAIGTAAALAVGSLTALNEFAYRSVIGVIEFFKTIPVIAILPIVLVLWGATLTMKVALVAFAVFWPLVTRLLRRPVGGPGGARHRDGAAAARPARFVTVILPSAAPYIATGMRVAAAVALIVAIVTELIGGGTGIGERILLAENARRRRLPRHVRVHRRRRPARGAARRRVHGRGTARAALARVAPGCG